MKAKEPGERQSYHHGDLRRALLLAAEEELTGKGPEGFTLRGCAKRAGVSHAAPAHHFGDAAGLLSALAAEGFKRFVATMDRHIAAAGKATPEAKLVASGLGYVAFARANPALFRLMFSSNKPDYGDADLVRSASAAFEHLVANVAAVRGDAPLATRAGRQQVAAVWSMAHGLSDLLLSQRLKFLSGQSEADLQRDLAAILARFITSRES